MDPETLETADLSLAYEMRQPHGRSTVWQANQLSIARYQATEMAQKLILYAVAMIEAKSTGFARYRIHVAAYAAACGIEPNNVYARLKAAAEDLAHNPLLIEGHIADDGKIVDLLTHWFAQVELGDGYIDVTFPPGLKKYLIEVRREHFKFDLGIPLQFSGEHAIRLYQWAKRWKFTGHGKSINLNDLRCVLGLVDLDKRGKVTKERLTAYGDLKKWALTPALNEINRASDILLHFKEIKVPGTKRVESLAFSIHDNPAYTPTATPKLLPGVKVAAPVHPAVTAMRETLLTEFKLSPEQTREAIGKYPLAYIEEKAAIVRSRPCDNLAAVLLSALKKDYQPAKSNKPAKKVKKPAAPAVAVEPARTPEEEAASQESLRLHVAAFRARMKGGARKAEDQEQAASVPAAVAVSEGEELPF